jgi:hypothetical protein
MMVDAYCLQHPENYCASAKSFAAHLTGLCSAFEHGSHHSLLRATQRWLNGPSRIEKPELPEFKGTVTIADVLSAPEGDAFPAAIEDWARSTWDAYESLQPLARRWLHEALGN